MATAKGFSGEKIRQARHSSGFTQAELALRAGTRERNIIRWENDQHTPRFEHVAAIAAATGRDVSFFLVADGADGDADDEEEDAVSDLDLELLRVLRKWREGIAA